MARSPFDFAGLRFRSSTPPTASIWFHDVRHALNRSRKVAGFHTPAALGEMLERDFDRRLPGPSGARQQPSRLRPYQIEANTASSRPSPTASASMLVAMATGTGKTFTLVNQVYRLMKSGVARRILFLVDRRALAAQAVRAFASFEPEPGLKFDKIYEVYSQRFQREDFGGRAVRPQGPAQRLPAAPASRPRLRLRLHDPAHGDQPLRPRRDLRAR